MDVREFSLAYTRAVRSVAGGIQTGSALSQLSTTVQACEPVSGV